VANYTAMPLSRDHRGAVAVPPYDDSGAADAAGAPMDVTTALVPDSRRGKRAVAKSTTVLRRVSDEVTAAALPLDILRMQGKQRLLLNPPLAPCLLTVDGRGGGRRWLLTSPLLSPRCTGDVARVASNLHASEKQFRRLPPCGGAPPSLLPWVGAVEAEVKQPPALNSSSEHQGGGDRDEDDRQADAAPMERRQRRRRRRRVRVFPPPSAPTRNASAVRPSAASGGVCVRRARCGPQGHWPLPHSGGEGHG